MADFQSHGCECATIVKQRVGKKKGGCHTRVLVGWGMLSDSRIMLFGNIHWNTIVLREVS